MIVAIIGSTVTDAVHREIQAALDRSPCPPIGVFFDSTVIRDERAESARNELRDLTVFGDFRSVVGLRRHVSSFLAQKVHLARRNRASPVLLSKERIVVAPGEEERRSFLMIGGDTIIAYAQAIKPDLFLARQRFHLGLFSSSEFVQRTESTPYTRFDVASERYSFEQSLSAERAGYCYVVVRRPWWFQLGRATVDLTILLSRLGT